MDTYPQLVSSFENGDYGESENSGLSGEVSKIERLSGCEKDGAQALHTFNLTSPVKPLQFITQPC